MTNSCIQSWGSGLVIWQMSLNDTLCPSQVWINWSSFRATRTRRSIRKPSTWSSATSTRRTKTRRWLPPWTCSSSSSSFSSARPRWKASSYNPAPPASCAPLASRSPSAHLSHSMPTANLRRPRLPRSFDIDLIIIMITKKKQAKTKVHKEALVSNMGQVLPASSSRCLQSLALVLSSQIPPELHPLVWSAVSFTSRLPRTPPIPIFFGLPLHLILASFFKWCVYVLKLAILSFW